VVVQIEKEILELYLQDRLDKWEEIAPYYFQLAYTGVLNIPGFDLQSAGKSKYRTTPEKKCSFK